MSVSAGDMLRRLASGVVPDGMGVPVSNRLNLGKAPGIGAGVHGLGSFNELLKKAQLGAAESGLPVTLDAGLGVALTDSQLKRLGQAADRAEAEGFSTALVSLDSMTLVLDVAGRRVTQVATAQGRPVTGIDGLIVAPPAEPEGAVLAAAAQSAEAKGGLTPSNPAPVAPTFSVDPGALIRRLGAIHSARIG